MGNKRKSGADLGRLVLVGESGESAANLGRLGSQPREVKTHGGKWGQPREVGEPSKGG